MLTKYELIHIFHIVHSGSHEAHHLLEVLILGTALAGIHLTRSAVTERECLSITRSSITHLIASEKSGRLLTIRITMVVHNIRSTPSFQHPTLTLHSRYPGAPSCDPRTLADRTCSPQS